MKNTLVANDPLPDNALGARHGHIAQMGAMPALPVRADRDIGVPFLVLSPGTDSHKKQSIIQEMTAGIKMAFFRDKI